MGILIVLHTCFFIYTIFIEIRNGNDRDETRYTALIQIISTTFFTYKPHLLLICDAETVWESHVQPIAILD